MKKKCQNGILQKSCYNLHVSIHPMSKFKPQMLYDGHFTIISVTKILIIVYYKQAGDKIS